MEIILRDTKIDDLESFFLFQTDKDAIQQAAFTSKNPDDMDAYIQKWTKLLSDPKINIRSILFENKIVGSVAKFEMEGQAEITYWIDRPYWGHGIASQALYQFLSSFEKTRPIFAHTAFDNFGSQKVLKKCGFELIETTKGYANAREIEYKSLCLNFHKKLYIILLLKIYGVV